MVLMPLFGACAPIKQPSATMETATDAGHEAASLSEPAAYEKQEPPATKLSGDLLYSFLLAEIAGQRGRIDLAIKQYIALARATRNPEVAARATRVAVYARDDIAAKEAALLWAEIEPDNADPNQVLAVIMVREGNTGQALQYLELMLRSNAGQQDQGKQLWRIVNLLSREKEHPRIKEILEKLMESHQNNTELLFAYAQILMRLEEMHEAKTILERLLKLMPDNDNIGATYVSVLNLLEQRPEALAWLKNELESGEDFDMRFLYARLLTDAGNIDEAIRQLEILIKLRPGHSDILFSLGLLKMQKRQFDAAQEYFMRLSEIRVLGVDTHTDDTNFYLGRIAEEKGEWQEANRWYNSVPSGKNYFNAQIRIALLLGKQKRLDEARTHLATIRTNSAEQQKLIVQTEAEMLIEAGFYQEALQVYNDALETAGEYESDLLYSRAMLAEKMGHLDWLENDLRKLLSKEPDNAQALNALGYTLADRTERYDEAYELIQRALELRPNDHYILDSMGWVLYRQGRLDEAIEFLNRALDIADDPEVAAHLGEVLWIRGDRKEAQEIWGAALKQAPQHELLLDIMERLIP